MLDVSTFQECLIGNVETSPAREKIYVESSMAGSVVLIKRGANQIEFEAPEFSAKNLDDPFFTPKPSPSTKDQAHLADRAIELIDLTSLSGCESEKDIEILCRRARFPYEEWNSKGSKIQPFSDGKSVAAVCVFPQFVRAARKYLEFSTVRLATVDPFFPHGEGSLSKRVEGVKAALLDGADEIDLVLPRSLLHEQRYQELFDQMSGVIEACGRHVTKKMILEVGELTSDQIYVGSRLAMEAGVDFIKTSTGKTARSATLSACEIMHTAICDHSKRSGRWVGIKPSGGIQSTSQALDYLLQARSFFGERKISRENFRFGASSLLSDLIKTTALHL